MTSGAIEPIGTALAGALARCISAPANYRLLRLIKEQIPYVQIVLDIPNISFGRSALRKIVNSIFLYFCIEAGLEFAIVNTQELESLGNIPEEERRRAES